MEGGEFDAEIVQDGKEPFGVLSRSPNWQAAIQRPVSALCPCLQAEFPLNRGSLSALCVAELKGGKTGRFVLCGHQKETVIPEAVSC